MNMTYLGNFTNVTDFPGLMQATQHVAWFYSPMIILTIFIVAFIALKQYETTRALTAATFISFISSILLFSMDLLDKTFVYVCIFGLGICALLLFTNKEY